MSISKYFILRGVLSAALLIWIAGFSILFINIKGTAFLYFPADLLCSTVCHQNPTKTFTHNSHHLLVCTRCAGIYLGAFGASVGVLFFSRKKISLNLNLLYLFSLPMLLDVILLIFNVYTYSFFIAFLSGLLFGSSVFIYILAAIENSLLNRFK